MNEDEAKVKRLLEEHFDVVIRTEKGTYKWNSITDIVTLGAYLADEMGYMNDVKLDHFIQAGVPDFLAYSTERKDGETVIDDYMFVEAKKESDVLRMSQLKWFNRFPKLNAQVIIHDTDEKKVKSFEPPVVNMIT